MAKGHRTKLGKKKLIRVTVKQLNRLKNTAISQAILILDFCDEILKSKNYTTQKLRICTGLYTLAFEEFGKVQYLRSIRVKAGMATIMRPDFEDHPTKFSLAMNCSGLPARCKAVYTSFFYTGSTNSPIGMSHTAPDMDTRMRLFYSNIGNDGNPETYPMIGKQRMIRAVFDLKTTLLDSSIC